MVEFYHFKKIFDSKISNLFYVIQKSMNKLSLIIIIFGSIFIFDLNLTVE